MNGILKRMPLDKRVTLAFLLLAAIPAKAQYFGGMGPSVLSRGGNAAGQRGSEPASLTFFVGVNGTYDNGLFIPQAGSTAQVGEFGAAIDWGVYGGHDWGRTSLGLDYRGDYRYFSGNSYQSGNNDAIDVTFSHVFNRRWSLSILETAGTTTQPYGAAFVPSYSSSQNVSVPINEIYNSRIYYDQTFAYATYNWSARTMITFGGGGFLTHRTVAGLVDDNGAYAQMSWQRLVTRRSALGATYMYTKYSYPPAIGSSDIHTVGGTYQRNVGRDYVINILAGASRIENYGTESYALSPEIAAILGTPTGTRFVYSVVYIPAIQASLVYRKRYWSFNAGYSHGASPGNGVYLTSTSDVGSVGASYSPLRQMSFGLSASYGRMKSLWGDTASNNYNYAQGGGGVTYALGRSFNLVARADWRRTTAGVTIDNQDSVYVTVGISYSNATRPLSLW
jgi:hypothetical protein